VTGPQFREPREPPDFSPASRLVLAIMGLGAALALILALVSAGRL